MTLKLARQALEDDPPAADAHVARGLETAERAMTELRELGHGILPSALMHGGLRAAVYGFVSRLGVPVDVADRVKALGGRLRIESAEGGGTVLAAELPLPHS